MVHDDLQSVSNVAGVTVVVGAGHGGWEQEPEGKDVLALLDLPLKVSHGEDVVIALVAVAVAPPVLAGTLTPVDMLIAHQPDAHVPVGSGLLGIEEDAALDELARHVDWLGHFHVQADVFILHLRRTHEITYMI